MDSYIGTDLNRSESDNGAYVSFVQSAVADYKCFTTFKRHPSYTEILEHASQAEGQTYLDIIKSESPDFIALADAFKVNDLVGTPATFNYDGIGVISPSTLRYMKVASDIRKLFGDNIGQTIAEIGVGYGGQLLINDRIFKMARYDLFDLPPVLSLASRYLESHILNCSYRTITLNQHAGNEHYDFVISNYAFSELPSKLQLKYIEKIVSRSARGYLTMNSGLPNSAFQSDKLSIDQLKARLPAFEVLAERPLTHPGNYIIVWGRV